MSIEQGWYHPSDESDQWDGFNDSGIEHFRGKPIIHLAREVIQNSLDAGESYPVTVKIKLHKVLTSSVPDISQLKKNINLCNEIANSESKNAKYFFENAKNELSKNEIEILEISDYNTTGMVGPCKNGTSFYAFMKAKGQSRKDSDTATGSFGIGKFAPYAVSKIRTIFVSTVYSNSDMNTQLTQGKSILMSHDKNGTRKEGVGFWGIINKCQPIEGISPSLPRWIQRANTEIELAQKGTKLTIFCFDAKKDWQAFLAVSIAENFFGAIIEGKLKVEIDNKFFLDKDNIKDFFERHDVHNIIKDLQDEPERFYERKNYLEALISDNHVIVEESEMRDLGRVQARFLVAEGMHKKVCVLRNGMFITDRLSGLKSFNDFKDFVAVVQCKSTKGNELLRAMEPPRHDNFEPDRLITPEDKKKGDRALKELAKWIRGKLKQYAKEASSDVTEIDELRDFFGIEGDDGNGKGIEEINPFGKVLIRAKPLKVKISGSSIAETENLIDERSVDGDEVNGSNSDGETGHGSSNGGTMGEGSGSSLGGNLLGGTADNVGDEAGGGTARSVRQSPVTLRNFRSILTGEKQRKVAFTPKSTGRIKLRFFEAGADVDYEVIIVKTNKGDIKNGHVVLDVTEENRCVFDVELNHAFKGAMKVVGYEI